MDKINEVFPDRICLEDAGIIKGSRVFKTEKPFRFLSSMGLIIVPAGFYTDGASIPKPFHNILGPFGSYFPSALVHDYNYSSFNTVFTREESDELFLEGMDILKVPFLTRYSIYYAVRLFGWMFYSGYNE